MIFVAGLKTRSYHNSNITHPKIELPKLIVAVQIQLAPERHAGAASHHGEQACASVPCSEVLVRKSAAIDADTPCAVAFQEITPLDAELLDDSVERGSLVA